MRIIHVTLLCGDCDSSRAVYHTLRKQFSHVSAVVEQPVSRLRLLRRRVTKLGIVTVIGQILFLFLVVPVLRRASIKRIREIMEVHKMSSAPITGPCVHSVGSVNSAEVQTVLAQLEPEIIVVNGTRIIGKKTLAAIKNPLINIHSGITPMFRGVHGGYWALVEKRPDLVGSTLHFVDAGIDTGKIIQHLCFEISDRDNFATYPYLHTAVILPSLGDTIEAVMADNVPLEVVEGDLRSQLRTHPTFWEYLYTRITARVK